MTACSIRECGFLTHPEPCGTGSGKPFEGRRSQQGFGGDGREDPDEGLLRARGELAAMMCFLSYQSILRFQTGSLVWEMRP